MLLPTSKRLWGLGARIQSWWFRIDLNCLATLFGDKWGSHWYTPYDRYFRPLKSSRLNVLEIGVGAYEESRSGGVSLCIWKSYFRHSRIVGIVEPARLHRELSLLEAG
jgi:hypothetical protein